MRAWTNATGKVPSSKGVLRPERLARTVAFNEVEPTPVTAALTGIAAGSSADRIVAAEQLMAEFGSLGEAPLDARVARDERRGVVGRIGAGENGVYEGVSDVLRILRDPDVTRVDELGARCSLTPRTLQRLFQRHIGVSPKWVLRRYRLHDPMTSIDDGYAGSLADLATGLGWYDQSQFARDFASLVATSPSSYRDRPQPTDPRDRSSRRAVQVLSPSSTGSLL